jgi:hypothetical protein
MPYMHRLMLIIPYLAVKRPIPIYSTVLVTSLYYSTVLYSWRAGDTENGEKIREFLFEIPQISQKHLLQQYYERGQCGI